MRSLIALACVLGCAKEREQPPAPLPAPPAPPPQAPAARPKTTVDPERPEPLPSEAPVMGDGKDLPPVCVEYRRLIAKLTTCENMPHQSREALRDAFHALDSAFTSVGSDARASIEQACKTGVDSIKQVTKTLCDL